jgi:hypothetical protein
MGLALGTARKRWYLEVTRHKRWLMLSQMTLQRVSDSSGMDTDKKAHSHQSCAATLMTATHNQEKVRPATDQANRNNAPGT